MSYDCEITSDLVLGLDQAHTILNKRQALELGQAQRRYKGTQQLMGMGQAEKSYDKGVLLQKTSQPKRILERAISSEPISSGIYISDLFLVETMSNLELLDYIG